MTETITKKRRVKVDVYSTEMNRVYNGRLLGLIDDSEFNHLLSDKPTQIKCKTRATIPVREIVDNHENLRGLRLMIVVHKIDEESAAPHLFVSERLHMVSYVNKPANSYALTGESESWLMIEERLE